MSRPQDALPGPESLLLRRSLAPVIQALPEGSTLTRLRVLAQVLGDLPAATVIGTATLQASLDSLVEQVERGEAGGGEGREDADEELGVFARRPLAALLILDALRSNPALTALRDHWAVPTPSVAASLAARRARLELVVVPALGMTLREALAAPARAAVDLQGQLRYLTERFATALGPELAQAAQLAVDRTEQLVVGVNRFQEEEPPAGDLLRIDPAIETAQVARVQRVRATRNAALASESLDALAQAASGDDNVMPHILRCVESHVTLGEISHKLRDVFGVYQETPIL